MISVHNVDSIAAVEGLYQFLERSESSQQLRIPSHLRGEVFGSRAALIQFIITWTRRFPEGQLVAHAQRESDAEGTLHELCDEEYGIVSLLMAPDVVGMNDLSLTKTARIQSHRSYFESLQQPRQRGKRLFLLVCDHLGLPSANLAFLNLSSPGSRAERKQRFTSYFREYLRTFFLRVNAPPFRRDSGERLSEIVYELFANAEEWGSFGIDGTPLARSVRGIFVELHTPERGNGVTFRNTDRDPEHFTRYLSRLAQIAPGKVAVLELSVFDSGIGLAQQWRKKLITNETPVREEYDAIIGCFGKHLSSSQSPTRGLGLFAVMQLLTRTKGYLKFRGGRAALYRDFMEHPHPYAERREAPPVVGKGEGRKQLEFLLDWTSSSSETYRSHGYAEGALVTVLIPLIQTETQMDLPFD